MEKIILQRLSLVMLIMLGAVSLLAQRPRFRPQVHEVNVQLFSANHVPVLKEAYPDDPAFSYNFANALRYKYHLDARQSLRGGLLYRTAEYLDPEQIPPGIDFYRSETLNLELRAGYEYAFNLMRFQVYAGAEGILGWGKEDFMYRDPGYIIGDTDYLTYGLSGFLGIRYFLHTQWSVSLEAEGYYLANNFNAGALEGFSSFVLFPGEEKGFNLLSVQIAYHFKRMRKSCTCGKPGS